MSDFKGIYMKRPSEEGIDLIVYTYLEGLLVCKPDMEFFSYSKIDYEKKYEKVREDTNYREFEIRLEPEGEKLGVVVLQPIDFENRNARLKISFCDDYDEKILKDVFKSILNYCFNDLNLVKIYGLLPENEKRFINVVEHFGNKEVTLYHSYYKYGKLWNLFFYGIRRDVER